MIRPMKREDKEAVLGMMRDFYSSPAVLSNGSDEIFSADIETCVNGSPYLEGYVFENEGAVSGYAMVAKSFYAEFGKPCIWIEDLYILPNHRRKGLGKEFFALIFKKYEGCVFRLEVEEENVGAFNLYKRCGFEILPYTEMKYEL